MRQVSVGWIPEQLSLETNSQHTHQTAGDLMQQRIAGQTSFLKRPLHETAVKFSSEGNAGIGLRFVKRFVSSQYLMLSPLPASPPCLDSLLEYFHASVPLSALSKIRSVRGFDPISTNGSAQSSSGMGCA